MRVTDTRRDRSRCIYCGRTDNLTKDHVPPKNLFPESRPSDLITVPACGACNKLYELDDEYYRIAITVLGEEAPTAAALWREKVVRGTFKRSPALKSSVLRTLDSMELRTPAGLYVGQTPTVKFDAHRFDRVTRRIITALHWHESGAVPRTDARMKVVIAPDPKHPALLPRLVHLLLERRPWRTVGGGLFRYAFNHVADRPDWSAWLLLFFSAAAVLVIVSTGDGDDETEG